MSSIMEAWAVILIFFVGFIAGVFFTLKVDNSDIVNNYKIGKVKTKGDGNNIDVCLDPAPMKVSSPTRQEKRKLRIQNRKNRPRRNRGIKIRRK